MNPLRICVLLLLVVAAIETGAANASYANVRKNEALRGDGKAAYELYYYYSLDEGSPKEALFWLRLGAEFGHCPAMLQLAVESTTIYPDFALAEKWLQKFKHAKCERPDDFSEQVRLLRAQWGDAVQRKKSERFKHSQLHSMEAGSLDCLK